MAADAEVLIIPSDGLIALMFLVAVLARPIVEGSVREQCHISMMLDILMTRQTSLIANLNKGLFMAYATIFTEEFVRVGYSPAGPDRRGVGSPHLFGLRDFDINLSLV